MVWVELYVFLNVAFMDTDSPITGSAGETLSAETLNVALESSGVSSPPDEAAVTVTLLMSEMM